ncbi:MAG: dihydropyrimidinase [Dehalococcoidia bacterium]
MGLDYIIRGGTLVTASESFPADIGVADGKIAAIGGDLARGEREIDASGKLVVPGAVDVHTHFQHYVEYIGSTNADDWESGTRAAAVGGTTTIVNFAFQEKGKSLRGAVEHELENAERQAHIDYGIHVTPTDLSVQGVLDELPVLADEGFASVKIFTAVALYALNDHDVLRVLRAARDAGLLVNVHAEDDALIGCLTDQLLSAGETGVENLPRARPPATEAIATHRAAAYAHALETPIYFVHLSSREALDEVRRARSEGAEVYVETRPVYLYLDNEKYSLPNREGNKYVCLPPLRSKENQDALWDGIRNGEINTYATDHAPWMAAQKTDPARPFPQIPAGVANVQTSMGMLFAEGVTKGRISVNQFVAVSSTNPAKLFGMWPRKGTLAVGADADIVLIDPQLEVEISAEAAESKADYEPYDGFRCVGWPVLTMSRGDVIAENGEFRGKPGRGELLRRARYQPL